MQKVWEVLDKANLRLRADKYEIACVNKNQMDGYELTGEVITLVYSKAKGISQRLGPNNLRDLR